MSRPTTYAGTTVGDPRQSASLSSLDSGKTTFIRRDVRGHEESRTRDLQRTAAVGLILLQALEIGMLLQMRSTALAAAIVGLGGWLASRYGVAWNFSMSRWSSGAAALLLAWYYAFPQEVGFHGYIGTELAFMLASFCLAVQILILFHQRFRDRLPYWFLLLSGLGLIIGADARVTPWQSSIMIWLVLAYLGLWGMFASTLRIALPSVSTSPSARTWILTATILLAGMTTWGTSTFLRGHQEQLERWVTNYLIQSELAMQREGFSGTGGIRDISFTRMRNEYAVSLRIASDVRPGYLRGQAFSRFNNDRWYNPQPVVELLPSPRPWDGGDEQRKVYLWGTMPADKSQAVTVWTAEASVARYLFLPRRTVAIVTTAPILNLQEPGIVLNPSDGALSGYIAITNPIPDVEMEAKLAEYRVNPRDLPTIVPQLAEEVLGSQMGDGERIQAVQNFFRQNFTYSLNVRIPPDRNRLEFFLTEGRTGNCEFFATASVLLLRQAGIPARYVTGFLVSEQNPVDGLWLARHKDAHAWVEAYDRDRREWVIVESTPADGVPAPHEVPLWEQWKEAAQQVGSQALDYGASGKIWGWLLMYWHRLPAVLLIAWLLRYLFLMSRSRREVRAQAIAPETPQAGLVAERLWLDRRLARCGLRRAAGETLLRFAQRIENANSLTTASSLANWYRHYTELRFRPEPVTAEEFHRLRLERRSLTRNTRRS